MAAGLRLYAGAALAILVVGLSLTPWVPRMVRVGPELHSDRDGPGRSRCWAYSAWSWRRSCALVDSEQRGYISNILSSLQASSPWP